MRMTKRQTNDMMAQLQFLLNTLKIHLGEDATSMAESTKRMLSSRVSWHGKKAFDGPEGLAPVETLERLGRVYVLCLAEV
mmetsp:Transcript_46378/g.54188  ORF Transcript_46378/g.54188 Transcript_46378/m.54188 type:complete len:80 (+) Transcript_46378:1823-2062(+)